MVQTPTEARIMGAVIIGLRPSDHKDLNQLAERIERPAKEVAGILLEEAIRREARAGVSNATHQTTAPAGPGEAA
jgi:hypothetical protein